MSSFIVYRYNSNQEDGIKNESDEGSGLPSPTFSMNPICGTLNEISETVLRNQLLRRVTNGSRLDEGGGVITAQLPSFDGNCGIYFHIIPTPEDGIDCSHIGCIVHERKEELESFQAELDHFIEAHLKPVVLRPHSEGDLEKVMGTWASHSTERLSRGVLLLRQILSDVLAIAFINGKLELTSIPDDDAGCVDKFFDIASVFRRRDDSTNVAEMTYPLALDEDGRCRLDSERRPVDGDVVFFDEAAQEVIAAAERSDALSVKQIISNLHVKTAHDLNTVKRLLDQARDDYYALFRLHIFLERNRKSRLSLLHCFMEMDAFNEEEKDILRLLRDFTLEDNFPKVS